MTDIFARHPMPPCARLLSWQLLEQDEARGIARLSFEAGPDFLNPAGYVQGGFVAAMLDDTMGPAVLVASRGTLFCSTIDMHVTFLAPVRPGRLYGEGRVVRLGKRVGFVGASLSDGEGALLARAASSARLVPTERLPV